MRKRFLYVTFIALIGLLSAFYCIASNTTIFNDDFETYTLDETLNGKNNDFIYWICDDGDLCEVVNEQAKTGDQSVYLHGAGLSSNGFYASTTGALDYGYFTNWFYIEGSLPTGIFYNFHDQDNVDLLFNVNCGRPFMEEGHCGLSTGGSYTDIGEFSTTTWNQFFLLYEYTGGTPYLFATINNATGSFFDFSGEHLGRVYMTISGAELPGNSDVYFDSFGYLEAPPPGINDISITSPLSGSTVTTNPDFSGYYILGQGEWPALLIVATAFNDGSVTTTCPSEIGSQEWKNEVASGHYADLGFGWRLDNLQPGTHYFNFHEDNISQNVYNCFYCYFFNSATTSENKCPGYWLYLQYEPGTGVAPFTTWEQYCQQRSLSCSSTVLASVGSTFNKIFQVTTGWTQTVASVFDNNQVAIVGRSMGEVIPYFRGKVNSINNLFGGGLPLSQLLIFILSFEIMIIAYKLIVKVIGLIRGGG